MNGCKRPEAMPVPGRPRTEIPVYQGNLQAVRRVPAGVGDRSKVRTALPNATGRNPVAAQSQPLPLTPRRIASATTTFGHLPSQHPANPSGASTKTPMQSRMNGAVAPAFAPVFRPRATFPAPALVQRLPSQPNTPPGIPTAARSNLGVRPGAPIPPRPPNPPFVHPLPGPPKSQHAPPRPALPIARFPAAAQRFLDRRLAQPQMWTAQKAAPQPSALSPAIQRMDDGKWKLGAVRDAAKVIKSNPQYVDLLGKGVTIHHKISQVQLLELLKINQRARGKSTGASRFWGAVAKATKGMEGPEHKLILNIPANLETGPKSYLNNPGSSFDGNTVPTQRGRSYSFRSEQLSIIDRLYLEKGEDLTDEDWNQMADALEKATKHHGTQILSAPLMEQWKSEHGGFRRERTDEEKAHVANSQALYLLHTQGDLSLAFRGTEEELEQIKASFPNPVIVRETPQLAARFAQIDDVS